MDRVTCKFEMQNRGRIGLSMIEMMKKSKEKRLCGCNMLLYQQSSGIIGGDTQMLLEIQSQPHNPGFGKGQGVSNRQRSQPVIHPCQQ